MSGAGNGGARSGRRLVIAAIVGVGISVVLWAIGLSWPKSLLLGLGAVVAYGLRYGPATYEGDHWPERNDDRTDAGARREVARLSWGLQGYENRVELSTVRRLRRIAAARLAESGLSLERPEDADACRERLGDQTHRLLTQPDPVRPLLGGFALSVLAVENLSRPDGGRP